ncbi:UDP-3-O-(3-hydroxymyristoyl)glucosamine N-acyltransferase [Aestuariibacter halophilus]|uniref:UDP-3-O-acylglucosamine N-acyltransferase n=1 Tax=Fluctibacter halophilus TaxID=226011 RepID=A0ABS8GEF4_9ALTE|nr:UDP-3-O-(3-hydroxymyristoyl)glucosamine N-acyltransferase [Aestuariibacter halophilus]MCC2618174.1 UDP-3-O-(3-hydroxymyristoyl)glucosamine N-acyltransferase [Aestuariibacter halophilus]
MQAMSLAELARQIGATLHLSDGDSPETPVHGLATLSGAGNGQISFLSNSKYRSQLQDTSAQAVILHPDDLPHCPCSALVTENPYVGFAKAAQCLDNTPDAAYGIAPTAVIADDVTLGSNVAIGDNAVIASGVVLGDNVQVGAGCVIGQGSHIGARTKLWANVTVYHRVRIGDDCLVQSGTVIGADGFGYANDNGQWLKIPQLGTVIIGNRVEIGASTTIDRGALDDTVIHDGVIIDNQVQIAHNVVIKENTAMAGCSVIAGSTTIGRNCTIGGLSGINGHITIGDNVHFTGMSMVTKDIDQPGVYSSGVPAETNREWRKNMVALRRLPETARRVKELEKHVK